RSCVSVPPSPPHPSPLSLHDALPIWLDHDELRRLRRGPAMKDVVDAAPAAGSADAAKRPVLLQLWDRRAAFKPFAEAGVAAVVADRKSTRLNSSHVSISYAVFCLKKK